MREPYEVLVAPVVTEKTTDQMDEDNVYTFIVSKDANKIEIRHAVEKMWDVTVQDVRTMRYSGKAKRSSMGQMARSHQTGRRPSFKKAVVKLTEGDHIELYEAG